MVSQAPRWLSGRGGEQRWLNPRVLVGFETLLAVALGLVLIGDKSFWLDEARSVSFAKLAWPEFWRQIIDKDANQSLYFLLLRPWLILGEDEGIVRSFSVIFAAATIPLTYLLGARLFGVRAGLVAALLMAANAFFIHYAQEARAYSLVLLLVTASSYLFVTCLESASRRRWAAYALVSGIAVYAHVFAGFVVMAQAASLYFLGFERVPWRNYVAACLLMALLVLPFGLFVLFRESGQLDWVPEPSLSDPAAVLVRLSGGRVPGVAYALASGAACLVAFKTWRGRGLSRDSWRYALLLSWLFLPLAVAFTISQFDPIFFTRFFMVCLPPLVLLVAAGLCQIGPRSAFGAAFGVTVLLSLYGVVSWYQGAEKDDWRGAAGYVLESSESGDAVVFFSPGAQIPFDYYRERLAPADRNLSYIDYASGEQVAEGFLRGSSKPAVSATLGAELAQRYDGVWLVLSITSITGAGVLEQKIELIEAELQENYISTGEQRFDGIRVVRF